MSAPAIVLTAALVLNFFYVGMAFFAFNHVKEERRDQHGARRLLALTLWWPFYTDLYDDPAVRASRYGKVLLFVTAALYVIYAVLIMR